MARKPEEYAREQIVKSVNHWPHAWMNTQGKELYAVSPVANVYAVLQGVRSMLATYGHHEALSLFNDRYGTSAAPQLGDDGKALVQESGKPDLFACLLDKDGRTISVDIEVKAFISKFALDDSLWRENQKDWMHRTTFGWGYWIFLWGMPDPIPAAGLRSKAARESMKAWLIPGMIWERKAEVYYNNVKQYTIHMSLENVRVKKALKDAGMTVDDVFSIYEMEWRKSIWWPNPNHPLMYMLEEGIALGPACTIAGDADAKYTFPPKIKNMMPVSEKINGTTDQ